MVKSQPYGNGKRDLWALFWPSNPRRNTTLIQRTPEAVPYPCDNNSRSPTICCVWYPPSSCCVFYFDHKNITHVNNINLSTFNTKARRISRWQKLSKCSPLPRRQPRTRNYPSHTPLMIISWRNGAYLQCRLGQQRHKNPLLFNKTPHIRREVDRAHNC